MNNRPTVKQLRYLRQLAQRTGTSFSTPTTKREASAEIQRLQNIKGRGRTIAERMIGTDQDDTATGYSAAIQAFEVGGYGSRASLKSSTEEPYDGFAKTDMWG